MSQPGTAVATVELGELSDRRVELGVIRADKPAELVKFATEAANALAAVIEDRKLYSNIQGKKFVRCEGWTTLAAMLGVTPHEIQVTETEGAFTATVELRRLTDGAPVSRASAECGPDEATWKARARYARRSMALTRATAKACRLAFSWIMALSGYEVTPAEEIPQDEEKGRGGTSTARQASKGRAAAPPVASAPPPQESLDERPRAIVDAEAEPAAFGQTSADPVRAGGPVWPCGNLKGTPLSRISSDDLLTQRDWAAKTAWVTKKYPTLIEEVDAEMRARQGE